MARRIGGLASRVRPLRADIRPRVRHFVYCVRIAFGHSQTRRPARFVLNAEVAPSLYVYYPAFDAVFLSFRLVLLPFLFIGRIYLVS